MYQDFNRKYSIQFNAKTLLNDGDPVSSQLIFPGAIQTYSDTVQWINTMCPESREKVST